MKQHPIPHNILDIEFKLFTRFTVREFIYMATGITFGGIFLYLYTKDLMPAILAIPIFLISAGTGLFLGLVPINDQKADVYLKNFLVAINSPTQRVWKNKLFDEKFKGFAKSRGVILPTEIEKKGANSTTNAPVIVGADQTIPKNQFVEEQKLQKLDSEEMQRLQLLTKTAIEIDNKASAQQTQILDPRSLEPRLEKQQQTTSSPQNQIPTLDSTSTMIVPESATTATPAQPIPQESQTPQTVSNQLSLNTQNLGTNQTTFPDIQLQPGTLNVLILDKTGTPIQKVLLILKDTSDQIVLARISDENGRIVSSKAVAPGRYYIELSHDQHNFPEVLLDITTGSYPPIKIIEL